LITLLKRQDHKWGGWATGMDISTRI